MQKDRVRYHILPGNAIHTKLLLIKIHMGPSEGFINLPRGGLFRGVSPRWLESGGREGLGLACRTGGEDRVPSIARSPPTSGRGNGSTPPLRWNPGRRRASLAGFSWRKCITEDSERGGTGVHRWMGHLGWG